MKNYRLVLRREVYEDQFASIDIEAQSEEDAIKKYEEMYVEEGGDDWLDWEWVRGQELPGEIMRVEELDEHGRPRKLCREQEPEVGT
jgi:hypothetical protein